MKRVALARKTPMVRTAFKSEPKPASGEPRQKKCAVRTCRHPFIPCQPFVTWCSPECGAVLALEKIAKQKAARAKAERAEIKRRKEAGMTLNERKKALEKLVNRYVVLRDWGDGCISCEKGSHWDGVWHASHFKSVGSNSALRYNLLNIHKSCSQCNVFRGGSIATYEPKLELKIGREKVQWLKFHDRSRDYTAEYLTRFAAIMRRKIKRLEARMK